MMFWNRFRRWLWCFFPLFFSWFWCRLSLLNGNIYIYMLYYIYIHTHLYIVFLLSIYIYIYYMYLYLYIYISLSLPNNDLGTHAKIRYFPSRAVMIFCHFGSSCCAAKSVGAARPLWREFLWNLIGPQVWWLITIFPRFFQLNLAIGGKKYHNFPSITHRHSQQRIATQNLPPVSVAWKEAISQSCGKSNSKPTICIHL